MFNPPSSHTVAPVPVQAGTWLTQEAQAQGLHLRGCVPVNADTGLPALPGHVQSVLVLVGTVGSAFWPSFSASPEYTDGLANPDCDAARAAFGLPPLEPRFDELHFEQSA